LLGWLRRILLNSMANFTRQFRVQKRRVAREASLDGTNSNGRARDQVALDAPSPSSFFMHQEQAEQLTLAIARLPEDYARVIRMRYWEQQSFEQIGETLKRSPDAARKLWARAIQRLQQELGDA
jgi:RNA polymerase sigma-70 factor (ECF subfamily)